MGVYDKRLSGPARTIFRHQCAPDGSFSGIPAVPAKKAFLAGFRAAKKYYKKHPDLLFGDKNATNKRNSDGGE